jgi:hypothetical protein
MTYDPDTVRGGPITGQQEYPGVRIDVIGRLDTARPRFHVDVGFGDVVVPSPLEADYPTLLDLPAPHLSGYTRESLIAEKFEAMLRYGELNSRDPTLPLSHALATGCPGVAGPDGPRYLAIGRSP